MGKGRKSECAFSEIEPGLREANKNYIRWNRNETLRTKILVERIVQKIIAAMKKRSPNLFAKLYANFFGGGSSYEGLKVGEPGEFDIDFLFKMPDVTKPVLIEDTIPGFVQLQLQNFENLATRNQELYRSMKPFVDPQFYLLTTELKSILMQSTFDGAINDDFPNGIIPIGKKKFTIERVQNQGPAMTLTIKGFDFFLSIDLVPCIVLTKNDWPEGGFRSNPYLEPDEFFIVPKKPKREHPHIDRYLRLSSQMQERKIIFDKYWVKPTIRIMKRMRDCFKHDVSSYAIKTLFMWEIFNQNPDTPELWKKSFSFFLVYMLEKYLKCLEEHRIMYFWNKKLDLLDNLSYEQIESYRRDVGQMIDDIKTNPCPKTILYYLEPK